MNRFLSDLDLIPQGKGRLWVLDSSLRYHSDRHGDFEIPRGFECDLSSIPLGGLGFARPTDWPQAGVLHDWLYRTGCVERGVADDLYREALIACGCSSWVARTRWLALRAFGWHAYQQS